MTRSLRINIVNLKMHFMRNLTTNMLYLKILSLTLKTN